MLRWISVVGGLLIMMGQHDRSEALFYYFRLEDQIPETHLLRLIDKHIHFEFVRRQLKDSYSGTGRPSIDPELLLRILLIGFEDIFCQFEIVDTSFGTGILSHHDQQSPEDQNHVSHGRNTSLYRASSAN